MCRGRDLWIRVEQRKCSNACKTWKQLWWNSWIARCWKRGWSARAWRRIFQAYSLKNGARLVVLMTMELAFSLDTNDVVVDAADAANANMIANGLLKVASKSSGRSEDSGFVCWCWQTSECRKMQKDHDVRQSKGSRIVDSKASKESLAEDVDMVNVDLNALEIGPVLLLKINPRDSEWNRIACCDGCVRFAWCVAHVWLGLRISSDVWSADISQVFQSSPV